uniref:uncharacterized protein LOC109969483 isoform X2 n=1 Tax=Monopterus albus TaxID=43700 RepID=UPI0009B42E4E|nr:uncharacterized protein LOC109969483 isoform X2 [Monopterus albus]
MSVDGTKLLFEGFLQKRKDTMKIRWVTYWFRLQNTTLFFYTQKNCSASHLRGYYYIYTVQSVREVQRSDGKRFKFEIIMTNGKRKMLAAETAALRKEWVAQLWQAMHLSAFGVSDSRSTDLKVCEQQQERFDSTMPVYSHSDSVLELLPARPFSAPPPLGHIQHESSSIAFPVCLHQGPSSEEPIYQNTLPACDSLNNPQWYSGLSSAEDRQEGDYDVLPLRNKRCEISVSTEMDEEEEVYDVPLSYRGADEHHDPTESIYDVPSSLRMMPDHTTVADEQQEEEIYLWI